jgi:hypothetical protein
MAAGLAAAIGGVAAWTLGIASFCVDTRDRELVRSRRLRAGQRDSLARCGRGPIRARGDAIDAVEGGETAGHGGRSNSRVTRCEVALPSDGRTGTESRSYLRNPSKFRGPRAGNRFDGPCSSRVLDDRDPRHTHAVERGRGEERSHALSPVVVEWLGDAAVVRALPVHPGDAAPNEEAEELLDRRRDGRSHSISMDLSAIVRQPAVRAASDQPPE